MFRIRGLAWLALFVALSSAAVLAQSNTPQSPARQKFDHKLKITSRYNQSHDTTVVQFFLKQPNSLARLAGGGTSAPQLFGEDIGISVSFAHHGRALSRPVDEADIWVAYTGGARTAVTSELSAIVDGQEVVLGRQVHAQASPNRRQGISVHSFSLSVTRDHLTEMANGSKVVLVLPSSERITLTREQHNALADFTSRMSP